MLSPEFRRQMAIGEATRLWRRYGFSGPEDLVLDDLAFALGVVVVEDSLDSADGRLVRKGNRGLVRVRVDIRQTGRKRFVVAHELGHFVLHKDISQILACTSEEMSSNYKGSEPEIEANYFAAELLMPEHVFGAAIRGTVPSRSLITTLADKYETTMTATAVRYVELSSDYCVMIIAERGRVRWWRASPSFDRELWIQPGLTVTGRTLAGKFFASGIASAEPHPIGMNEWAERYPDFAETAIESAIPLGDTGQVLTLLWLL